MLLRHRPDPVDERPESRTEGFEHLSDATVTVLRWLASNRVEFVLIGAVARAIRGERSALGAVTIVPAPYGRNQDRLERSRFAQQELEIVLRPEGAPPYQDLMYEATRFQITPELPVDVAAPEDIELYDHLRRTGVLPQMKLTRS